MMRIGKTSRAIILLLFFLGTLFGLFALVNYIIPNERSLLFNVVWLPILLLAGTLFQILQRRLPAISDAALIKDGPSLTLGRAAMGCGLILVWVSALVVFFTRYQFGHWQTFLVWAVTFAGLLWILNWLEHRWLKQDKRS